MGSAHRSTALPLPAASPSGPFQSPGGGGGAGRFGCRDGGPRPQSSDSVGLGWAPDSAFLTSSQVRHEKPSSPQRSPRTSITRELVRQAELWLPRDLLSQDLHFNKIPGRLTRGLKFKKWLFSTDPQNRVP